MTPPKQQEPKTPEPQDETPIDAVVVIKEVADDGNIGVRIVPNGNIQATEIETLLGLGLREWRKALGV